MFYLYNWVEGIEAEARLTTIASTARIGVAHGQLPEARLERVVLAFQRVSIMFWSVPVL